MAPTSKQSLKSTSNALTTSSSGLAQRSTTRQNLALIDTTNTVKQIDSAGDNSGKTN